jgi:hypothetical protein
VAQLHRAPALSAAPHVCPASRQTGFVLTPRAACSYPPVVALTVHTQRSGDTRLFVASSLVERIGGTEAAG